MDMKIDSIKDAHLGKWAIGTVGNFQFQALVFPKHAFIKSFELGRSRISKLWIATRNDIPDRVCLFNFDRGMDVAARGKDAKQAVRLLCKNVAKTVYETSKA